MKKTVYMFSGEGTRSSETSARLLKLSPLWEKISEILKKDMDIEFEDIWNRERGKHGCPYSPLITAVSQICLADLWQRWGYEPDVVVGHSTGELAAAYQAGLYPLNQVISLALKIGESAAQLQGAMLHGQLSDEEIDRLSLNISSFNFINGSQKHVTISGYVEEIEAFQLERPDFVKMKLPHPWHHPDYQKVSKLIPKIPSRRIEEGIFLSGLTKSFETYLKDTHWHDWMIQPIDFIETIKTLNENSAGHQLDIIEIGFHPVLKKCIERFPDHTYVSSMFRGEDDLTWIMNQRRKLDQTVLLEKIEQVVMEFRPDLDFGISLAYQGFDSLAFTELSGLLQPLFPFLSPQDFYRFKTINQLIEQFAIETSIEPSKIDRKTRNGVVIAGMSCRFPSFVETPTQFWEMLTSHSDQVQVENGRGGSESGFLGDAISRFDHQFFDISIAEAKTMDPQQILALELTEMLWRDAGIDPRTLNRKRVGVYIGAWSQEFGGDRSSVYYPSGTNPSIIAARISYHYDLRGPSWVSNTACSSSFVAVHYAAKDIEAGRVDYAIAGGVNMMLDEGFTASMRNAGFLSADNRCKTFDNSANGYVRAEGGGLVLLINKSLVNAYYAELSGSSINQNGGRSQVLTAPHPEAQEELIVDACQDAGIAPKEIAYVECHGTGTKIGDPIEISAIQNTVAKSRNAPLFIGSIKSNIGHLESAAGIAGLLKAVAALNHGIIPPNLHFNQPNQNIDFGSHPIHVVAEETPIDQQAYIGISSFGFGGSNAHIIVRGVEEHIRKRIQPLAVPFNRKRSIPLSSYLNPLQSETAESPSEDQSSSVSIDVQQLIEKMMFRVTGVEKVDPAIELLEQGLDSLSATEMLRQLEEKFGIEMDPEVLFEYPFIDLFVTEIKRRIAAKREETAGVVTRQAINAMLSDVFFQLTGIDAIDPEIELTDQGLDSMSATELVSQLEASLNVEIGPEMLFEFPLRDQFVDEVYALTGGGIN